MLCFPERLLHWCARVLAGASDDRRRKSRSYNVKGIHMTARSLVRRIALSSAAALSLLPVAGAAAATEGSWTAYPGQSAIYETAVQQPINADGSSNFKANGKGVIPVKFSLKKGLGPFLFESIYGDASTANDFSYLTFTPSSALNFGAITDLIANYAFQDGNCHGGSLRWTLRFSETEAVHVYYGDYPSFADCTTLSQSGIDMTGLTDLRFDTTAIGGSFYDNYEHAITLAGARPITRASLVLDSGWGGNQSVTLAGARLNDSTFTPATATPSASTCDLPAATIRVKKLTGNSSGDVNEVTTIQPADDDAAFRVVDCKYMYNLATGSLSGAGRYSVEVLIGGVAATGAATFELR
jgi:hypothetical protein